MNLPRAETRDLEPRHGEIMIVFGISETTLAIAATAVEEVRNTEGLRPLGPAPQGSTLLPKVTALLDRGGRTYWVIDASRYFHLLPVQFTRVLVLRHSSAALLVERVDLLVEVSAVCPLPRAFTGEERRWYGGLALIGGERGDATVVPVVNPEALLTETEAKLMDAWLRARGASA